MIEAIGQNALANERAALLYAMHLHDDRDILARARRFGQKPARRNDHVNDANGRERRAQCAHLKEAQLDHAAREAHHHEVGRCTNDGTRTAEDGRKR